MKVLINKFENRHMRGQDFVGQGDKVYASFGAEEFGFTVGNKYEIKGITPFMDLILENDIGVEDEYTVEYFTKFKPLID